MSHHLAFTHLQAQQTLPRSTTSSSRSRGSRSPTFRDRDLDRDEDDDRNDLDDRDLDRDMVGDDELDAARVDRGQEVVPDQGDEPAHDDVQTELERADARARRPTRAAGRCRCRRR